MIDYRDRLGSLLCQLGTGISTMGYILQNPLYWDVRKVSGSRASFRLMNKAWLRQCTINNVLDVGANVGQFLGAAVPLLPKANFFAFEPNSECANILRDKDWGGANVQVLEMACGEADADVPFHFLANSTLSSVLKPRNEGLLELGDPTVSRIAEVPVRKLDTVLMSLESARAGNFLFKMDVQGFEDRVLRGAEKTLEQTQIVICEVCMTKFYEDQTSLDWMVTFLSERNFRLVDIGGENYAHGSGELLFLDLAFKKMPS